MAVIFTSFETTLAINDILDNDNLVPYARYDKSRLGCNQECPIVIPFKKDYVKLEYDILEFLLNQRNELAYYYLAQQELLNVGDRALDCLTVRVFWIDRERGEIAHSEEKYYFDITEGFCG